jgi:hypothetical protein
MPPLSTGSCDISIKYGVLKMKPERIALQALEKESYQVFLTKTSQGIQIEGSFGKDLMNDLSSKDARYSSRGYQNEFPWMYEGYDLCTKANETRTSE